MELSKSARLLRFGREATLYDPPVEHNGDINTLIKRLDEAALQREDQEGLLQTFDTLSVEHTSDEDIGFTEDPSFSHFWIIPDQVEEGEGHHSEVNGVASSRLIDTPPPEPHLSMPAVVVLPEPPLPPLQPPRPVAFKLRVSAAAFVPKLLDRGLPPPKVGSLPFSELHFDSPESAPDLSERSSSRAYDSWTPAPSTFTSPMQSEAQFQLASQDEPRVGRSRSPIVLGGGSCGSGGAIGIEVTVLTSLLPRLLAGGADVARAADHLHPNETSPNPARGRERGTKGARSDSSRSLGSHLRAQPETFEPHRNRSKSDVRSPSSTAGSLSRRGGDPVAANGREGYAWSTTSPGRSGGGGPGDRRAKMIKPGPTCSTRKPPVAARKPDPSRRGQSSVNCRRTTTAPLTQQENPSPAPWSTLVPGIKGNMVWNAV